MNKTDRLFALHEDLRRAGPVGRSAQHLAERFEVSTRTIKRDVSTLQQAGVPIAARPGPGGGYVVDPAATLPPVALTAAEVSGLAAAVAAHRGQPFDGHARAALVKILDVMPPAARARATDLSERLWIDQTATPPAPRVRSAVEQGLHERRVLAITCRERSGSLSARVHPVLLAHTQGRWYLVGRCDTAEDVRWFRLDDIRSAYVTGDPAADIPVAAVGAPPTTAHPVADA